MTREIVRLTIYEMVCESKIVYGIEVWSLSEAWKELDKVHIRFFYFLDGRK